MTKTQKTALTLLVALFLNKAVNGRVVLLDVDRAKRWGRVVATIETDVPNIAMVMRAIEWTKTL